MFAVGRGYPDELTHPCSSSTNQHFTSRLKEESDDHYTFVHSDVSEVLLRPSPHATKDNKPLSQDVRQSARGAEGPQDDRVLACPLISGLILGKGERRSLLYSVGQPLPLQMAREQRRKLCMKDASYSHTAVGYPQPTVRHQQCGAAAGLQPGSAEEDRRMLTGMGVGLELPTKSPYMSFNIDKVGSKHSSIKDGHSYYCKDTVSHSCNSPSSSLPLESHREIPHYIGTSVIITNER